jgi:hypothetical protein
MAYYAGAEDIVVAVERVLEHKEKAWPIESRSLIPRPTTAD